MKNTMQNQSPLKILFILSASYILLISPSLIWEEYLDTPIALMIVIPYVSIYIFHTLGIPGLLQNNGLCGWGWCAPTLFGWSFLIVFWLSVLWVISWALSTLISKLYIKRTHEKNQTKF